MGYQGDDLRVHLSNPAGGHNGSVSADLFCIEEFDDLLLSGPVIVGKSISRSLDI